MGCEVLVVGADASERRQIERLFADRDRRFSRFVPESELNSVNMSAGLPVSLSPEFAQMLSLALAAAEQTNGLVEPTLGAALEAAGYDDDFSRLADRRHGSSPAARIGWREIGLVGVSFWAPAGTRLDLNGVVKGKTVDDALALVSDDGFVSAGGDIAVRGGAVVSLPGGDAIRVVSGALATSGRDRRTWRRGGDVQHHLIDPVTQRPSRSPWLTVTASGATCVGADVAAKAGFLLGAAGPERLDEWGVPARFVDDDGRVHENDAWRRGARREVAACT
jgi:thiamine biosynthesis lipoprotein ApbE